MIPGRHGEASPINHSGDCQMSQTVDGREDVAGGQRGDGDVGTGAEETAAADGDQQQHVEDHCRAGDDGFKEDF